MTLSGLCGPGRALQVGSFFDRTGSIDFPSLVLIATVMKGLMKKIKSPWYGVVWIFIWSAALIWFMRSGWFNAREIIGLSVVWAILVGITSYLIFQQFRLQANIPKQDPVSPSPPPALNALCPCGSGKKYKRCCAR